MPLPLKCNCHESHWEIHPEKIRCKGCNFTEHFLPHETVSEVVARMKMQGCYFLDKDANKLVDAPMVQLSGYEYR